MVRRTGRRTAILTGVLGFAVLAVFIFTSRNKIFEQWYIYRLKSDNEDVRLNAAEKLGQMKSVASIPYLVEAILKEPREHIFINPGILDINMLDKDNLAIWNQLLHFSKLKNAQFSPISHSLYSIGIDGRCVLDKERNIAMHDAKRKSLLIDIIIGFWENPKIVVEKSNYFEVLGFRFKSE